MSYWQDRLARNQDKITKKNVKEIEEQLKKYYGKAAEKAISDFEKVYDKIRNKQARGEEVTPAWLYQLDTYWQMQGQLRNELNKLGEKQIAALTRAFESNFFEVYYSLNLKGSDAFSTIDKGIVSQLINQVWVADGKNWSQRIWDNTERLAEVLNEQFVNYAVTGSSLGELKSILMREFNVSYSKADSLARTEMAHIQTQSAQQRYKDYGITTVEVFVDEDERTCPVCAKHEGERYPINAKMPVPFHPRCRCCMIPVVDDNEIGGKIMENEFDYRSKEQTGYIVKCKDCGHEWEVKYLSNFNDCPSCGKTNWRLDAEKTVYKDKYGTKKAFTPKEEDAEKEQIKQEARDRASRKTTLGTSENTPYTTIPLQKSITAAHEKEGEFIYFTHYCESCGRYFDSTVADKKKCPMCGEKLTSAKWKAKKHIINTKKCVRCGKLFEDGEQHNTVCEECREKISITKEAEKLLKKGYSKQGAVAQITGTSEWLSHSAEFTHDPRYLYYDYIKAHPEKKEEIEKIDYFEREKHFFVCVDCGEVVYVKDTKNNAQKRCPECQILYRKKYKAQKEKERRAKKKN